MATATTTATTTAITTIATTIKAKAESIFLFLVAIFLSAGREIRLIAIYFCQHCARNLFYIYRPIYTLVYIYKYTYIPHILLP